MRHSFGPSLLEAVAALATADSEVDGLAFLFTFDSISSSFLSVELVNVGYWLLRVCIVCIPKLYATHSGYGNPLDTRSFGLNILQIYYLCFFSVKSVTCFVALGVLSGTITLPAIPEAPPITITIPSQRDSTSFTPVAPAELDPMSPLTEHFQSDCSI